MALGKEEVPMNHTPSINILVRISRPHLWPRCLASIKEQTFTNWKIIAFIDTDALLDLSDVYGQVGHGAIDRTVPFFFNLFLNDMLAFVPDGWNLILDDDDVLHGPDALTSIAPHLDDTNRPVICQMLRNGMPKPADMYMDRRWVSRGRIGMPCIMFHSKWKATSEFVAAEDADYRFIDRLNTMLSCKFVKHVVVDVGSRPGGGNSVIAKAVNSLNPII